MAVDQQQIVPPPERARTHSRRLPFILLALVAAGLAIWFFGRAGAASDDALTGYIQSDTLYLSSAVAGTIQSVSAERGDVVEPGERLFTIDPATLGTEAASAGANVAEAQAQAGVELENVAAARADYQALAADARRAADDFRRYLAAEADKEGAVARQQIEAARAASVAAASQRDAARQRVEAAAARVRAAQARIAASREGLKGAEVRVGQLSPAVPARARVEDIFYQPGEWVAANKPIVSLIPDDKVKVRFYVPQSALPLYRPGRTVRFSCAGCADGLAARIDYVSPRPEYTPPIIYAGDSRDKLVFLVEARPAHPGRLAPGQPVDVMPLGATSGFRP